MIKLFINSTEVPIEIMKFPAGETGVRLDTKFLGKTFQLPVQVLFKCDFESNDDIFNLMQAVDAYRRTNAYYDSIKLCIDYFPYARQDRVCNAGESLSVKIVADLINSMKFDSVSIDDPHSDTTSALINNAFIRTQDMCIYPTILDLKKRSDNFILVAPDAGAVKKTFKIAQKYGLEMITATKHRDTKTGKLSSTEVHGKKVPFATTTKVYTEDFLVVDDICDGGGTFIPLAVELKKLTSGKVFLYVTHGLFTKGLDVFDGYYDQIYCHNSRIKNDSRVVVC